MYFAYKLNKQGDNIHLLCIPFPIWNQSVVPCLVLNCCFLTCIQVSQEAGKVVWYSHLLRVFHNFVMIHTIKGFTIDNEAEVDVFVESAYFFYDPVDVDSLISGSSALSNSSLNIWKFSVHVQFKPSLENFEHYFTSMWNEYSCAVVLSILWHCLSLGLEWKLTFCSPAATAEFSKFAGILSAALSQHYLLGFEITQLVFHHFC